MWISYIPTENIFGVKKLYMETAKKKQIVAMCNNLDDSLENHEEWKKTISKKFTSCLILFIYHSWSENMIEKENS